MMKYGLAKRSVVDALNWLGAPLVELGQKPELDAQRLIDQARRLAGCEDFHQPHPQQALTALIDSYTRDSQLTFIGRLAVRQDTLTMLVHRLQIERRHALNPALAQQPIKAPIFILGLPRTGTTLLHNLLSLDPRHRSPLTWEVMYPFPPRSERDRQRLIRAAHRRVAWLGWLAPKFQKAHEVNAEQPQECVQITGHSFESYLFEIMCRVPSYQRWLANRDLTLSYRWHRRFLQHLQCPGESDPMSQPLSPPTWVLKAPAHLFAIDSLLRVYPDARIVQTHRDPLKVMPSLASLFFHLRRAFSDAPERFAIGAELLERWGHGLALAMRQRDMQTGGAHVWVDLHYSRLLADPLAAVEQLYAAFNYPLDGAVADRMRAFLTRMPQHRFGRHRYTLDDFGMSEHLLERQFQGYRQRYDIAYER